MELDYFPGKGTLLTCIKGGNDGVGNRLRVGQQYEVTGIYTADGKTDSNGEVGEVTVTVSGQSVNPAAYPFRWDLADHFRPARQTPRAFLEELYGKLEAALQRADSKTGEVVTREAVETLTNEVEAYLSHTAPAKEEVATEESSFKTATPRNMQVLAVQGARFVGEGRVIAFSQFTGEEYSANPADYWDRPEDTPLFDTEGRAMVLITKFTEVAPA